MSTNYRTPTTHFAAALQRVLRLSYEDKQIKLVQATRIAPSTMSRLLTGETGPSRDRLGELLAPMIVEDQKALLMALLRDTIPAEYQPMIEPGHLSQTNVKEDPAGVSHLSQFIAWLKDTYDRDPIVRDWVFDTGYLLGLWPGEKP